MFLARRKLRLNRSLYKTFNKLKGYGQMRKRLIHQHLVFPKPEITLLKAMARTKIQGLCRFTTQNYCGGLSLSKTLKYRLAKFINLGYKSIRKAQGLPSRGQRTHSNGATAARLHKYVKRPRTIKK